MEPYLAAALASLFCSICITITSFILMRCVTRIGRISEDLRRSVTRMEIDAPSGTRQCSDDHNALEIHPLSRDE